MGRSAYSGRRCEAGRPIPTARGGAWCPSAPLLSSACGRSGRRDGAGIGCEIAQRIPAHAPADAAWPLMTGTCGRPGSGRRRIRSSGRRRWVASECRRWPVMACLRPDTRPERTIPGGSWREHLSRMGRANHSAPALAGQPGSRAWDSGGRSRRAFGHVRGGVLDRCGAGVVAWPQARFRGGRACARLR